MNTKHDSLFRHYLDRIMMIDGWMWVNELHTLHRIAFQAVFHLQPKEVLVEIGSWHGRSTMAIGIACKLLQKGRLFAVDPYDLIVHQDRAGKSRAFTLRESEKIFKKNIRKFRLERFVTHVKLTSREAFERLKHKKARFIFIDGDHQYEAVRADVETWRKMLVPNGYLLLHDTLNLLGPRRVMKQLLLDSEFVFLGITGDVSCYQKVARVGFVSWAKKLFSIVILTLLFRIYTPNIS